ncbi:MAG: hypothetical protein LDL41_07290 [Coleofasciculus sp. S288]|nr:hypothetical protein [Coleofasciculus sp. S288]
MGRCRVRCNSENQFQSHH